VDTDGGIVGFWKDNVLVGSDTDSIIDLTNIDIAALGGKWGSGATPADFWDGLIDEFGIWDRLLPSQERADLFNNNESCNPFDEDTVKPRINTSINNTSPKINYVINISANVTDETGLVKCLAITNETGTDVSFSLSISGIDDKCSQNFTVGIVRGNVINYTMVVNDTNGNSNQSSHIITVVDTIVTFILSTNETSPRINQEVNISVLVEDADTISMIIASWNGTVDGTWINISNTTTTLTSLNYTVTGNLLASRDNVVGYLFYSNDTVTAFTVSSINTFIVVNTPPSQVTSFITPSTDPDTANQNITINWSGVTDIDGDTVYYQIYMNSSSEGS
ncbi:hypothetical protein LCGC14_3158420, partial [marine sediment metagenome]